MGEKETGGASGARSPSPSPSPAHFGVADTLLPSAPTTETTIPTSEDICYVCKGDPNSLVDRSRSATIEGELFACGELEDFGLAQMAGVALCEYLQVFAPRECGCSTETTPSSDKLSNSPSDASILDSIGAQASFAGKIGN